MYVHLGLRANNTHLSYGICVAIARVPWEEVFISVNFIAGKENRQRVND